MPRILIITSGPLCRNPRPWKEAVALSRAGHEVVVLTVRNQAAAEAHDRELLRAAPFHRETIDLLPGFGTNPLTVFRRRLIVWAARQAAARLGLSSARALGPAGALLRRARHRPADLTIVHNEAPHWVGRRLLALGRRVAADFEDWHSEDLLPARRRERPLALLRANERSLLERAAYVTTTSDALAGAMAARYGSRAPAVITNAFPLDPAPRRGPPGDPPALFWFSQTIGPGRGLEAFFDAWARCDRPSRVVIVGEPYDRFPQTLLARVPAARRPAVTFRPPVPPSHLPALIAEHDVGLALEQSDIPSRDLTITNKILQYLNAGLAVAATPSTGQREVLAHAAEAGVLLDPGNSSASAAIIDDLIADRERLARRQQAARQLAATTYCWEQEAPKLLALVDAALSHPA